MQVKSIAECSKGSPLEQPAIPLNFIKLPFVIKIFVMSMFEWPFYTGFTVFRTAKYKILYFPGVCLVFVTVKFGLFFLVTHVTTSNAKEQFLQHSYQFCELLHSFFWSCNLKP